VKIASSLIGKRTLRSFRASYFSSSNFGANSVIISSNPFLSMCPRFVLAISAYVPVYQPYSLLVLIGLTFFLVDFELGASVSSTSATSL
jgi:hypothetical protein